MKTELDWVAECNYISDLTQLFKRIGKRALRNFNKDLPCFLRYCEMQKNSADKAGFYDSAEYIQSCIDDLDGYNA